MKDIREYLTNFDAADSQYTLGKLRDNPGDGTGSQVTVQLFNDMLYAFYAFILKYGTVSDTDETVLASDFVNAVEAAFSALAVLLTGNQTVAGVKTFSSIPVLPASDPTTVNQATRKSYVDTLDAANIKLTGAQTVAGIKTFSSIPVLPASDPTTDNQAARKAYVDSLKKVNWAAPQLLGEPLSLSGMSYSTITALNSTDFVCFDGGLLSLATYRFGVSSSAIIGSGLSLTARTAYPSLAALSETRVALVDQASGYLGAYDFSGSAWSQTGTMLSLGTLFRPVITALNSTDIALTDYSTNTLRTYRFNGSTWSLVGSALSISSLGFAGITTLNSTDIAFVDEGVNTLRTYRFNGSTWSLVGSALSITLTSIGNYAKIAALNDTDIVMFNSYYDRFSVYRFNGATWAEIGCYYTRSTVDEITVLNGIDFLIIDDAADEVQAYRMGYSLELPYSRGDLL